MRVFALMLTLSFDVPLVVLARAALGRALLGVVEALAYGLSRALLRRVVLFREEVVQLGEDLVVLVVLGAGGHRGAARTAALRDSLALVGLVPLEVHLLRLLSHERAGLGWGTSPMLLIILAQGVQARQREVFLPHSLLHDLHLKVLFLLLGHLVASFCLLLLLLQVLPVLSSLSLGVCRKLLGLLRLEPRVLLGLFLLGFFRLLLLE